MVQDNKKTPEQRLSHHKRFMKSVMLGAVAILVAVWGWYFWNFNDGVSGDQGAWGAFLD